MRASGAARRPARQRRTGPGGVRTSRARPVAIVAGLVLSFSLFTLFGTVVLSLLHLPAGLIRWVGIGALLLLGAAMLVPPLERLLERPFARLSLRVPRIKGDGAAGGFALGVALGAVYVPCAGPVLAAIALAGATDTIGPRTLILTAAFAVGTAIPLLAVALTGHRLADRVRALQRRQRAIRAVGGVLVIALAVALALGVTDLIQRRVPDYTQAVGDRLGAAAIAPQVAGTGSLQQCQQAAFTGTAQLADCGPAPEFAGIDPWIGGAPRTMAGLRGKVVLIDFWAYSCINCQRELPHAEAWWKNYRDLGFEVIGVHTPEYAFEHDVGNVTAGSRKLGLTFPIAVDNRTATWSAYRNVAWPAGYLVDVTGTIRLVSLGEGRYDKTETAIRSLLLAANPGATLPPATDVPDATPRNKDRTPELYLGAEKQQGYGGAGGYDSGTRAFTLPDAVQPNTFALDGTWTIDPEGIRARERAALTLSYTAQRVYLDVGGSGTLTVTEGGAVRTIPVDGPPDIRTVVDRQTSGAGTVTVALSPDLVAYSLTFG
ncbi:redoxin domain-containing protein [Tsukamurella ocularis]|uniref:redoxin domain-containing protein n=1 Tax=Tsukamurella ocularis TaxID=1970234 RepID=UPI002167375A|nr:cytochrome c biogenesis protein CcdA [Tsukamurella ocularis]MCS3780505.1 cytochrome c biogenesis protein CcdA/thiol-disulfide isomerase/thioredoxin [Tsukamurella ocularis]MCS3785940.1 cytochrome c biogenesis protein CcdA/thiol-disulfide isomerase/thioredoxin [Tsukamurella ocularis]MCS3849304.1 cytochrome c biogenesis protein CcdA/thiol-disulfide isomerase/thioredoxin [Tsukamurella ocularis]